MLVIETEWDEVNFVCFVSSKHIRSDQKNWIATLHHLEQCIQIEHRWQRAKLHTRGRAVVRMEISQYRNKDPPPRWPYGPANRCSWAQTQQLLTDSFPGSETNQTPRISPVWRDQGYHDLWATGQRRGCIVCSIEPDSHRSVGLVTVSDSSGGGGKVLQLWIMM
jgi:hypothetical protein